MPTTKVEALAKLSMRLYFKRKKEKNKERKNIKRRIVLLSMIIKTKIFWNNTMYFFATKITKCRSYILKIYV